MENCNILLAGGCSEEHQHRMEKLISYNKCNKVAICPIPVFRNIDQYHWDIIWNCSVINTTQDLDKCKASIYINYNTQGFCLAGDKWKCYQFLKQFNFPQVETSLTNIFGYPVIIKYTKGSFGYTVYLAHSSQEEDAIKNQINTMIAQDIKLNLQPGKIIYQRFVETSKGIDICAYMLGGKLIACMKRENHNDFRSHIFRGGEGSIYKLTPEETKMCEDIANVMQLDYCSINLLVDSNKLIVCEVNANAGTDAITKVTGVDVVQEVYNWALKQLAQKRKDGEI